MVVPFGSARERRSRTTYRPTVTPEGSTHVDTEFTGTTSSPSGTASRKGISAPAPRQRLYGVHRPRSRVGREVLARMDGRPLRRLDKATDMRTITIVGGRSRRLTARQGAKKMASGPQGDDDDVADDEELKQALDLAGFDPDKVLGD
ncbi:hypothetical protein GCM10010402_53050 [Actinomadura luteofluorescens]